jgi:tubulin epsilon
MCVSISQHQLISIIVQGFKVGLCDRAPLDAPNSLLCLGNNCCISSTLGAMLLRFEKLFSRNVYVHHYTEYMDAEDMTTAKSIVADLMQAYDGLNGQGPPQHVQAYATLGLG